MTLYQPWYVGQTYPSWDIPLTIASGADDLTGVDITKFTMTFRNTAVSPAVNILGTGTFSIRNTYPAEILYKPSAADVAAAFSGNLYIKALFPPSGTTADEVVYDPIPFSVTDW